MESNNQTPNSALLQEQVKKKDLSLITHDMVLVKLQHEGERTETFNQVLNDYWQRCEEDAEIEIKLAKIRKDPGQRSIANRANFECTIRRHEMVVALYKKGVALVTKNEILESLDETLMGISQQKETHYLIERIGKLINELSEI